MFWSSSGCLTRLPQQRVRVPAPAAVPRGCFVTRAAMMRGRSFDDDSIFNITVVLPNLLVKIFLLNIYGA